MYTDFSSAFNKYMNNTVIPNLDGLVTEMQTELKTVIDMKKFEMDVDTSANTLTYKLQIPGDGKTHTKVKVKEEKGSAFLLVDTRLNGDYSIELPVDEIGLEPTKVKCNCGILTVVFPLKEAKVTELSFT